MIYGVGTDLCDVRRIAAALRRRGDRFAQRVLGPQELATYRIRCGAQAAQLAVRGPAGASASSPQPVGPSGLRFLATRFAAKEAFSKAIGLGMRQPMRWQACEVAKAASGQPGIALHGALAAWFEERRLRAHLSITDETDYAAAFVVVEQLPP